MRRSWVLLRAARFGTNLICLLFLVQSGCGGGRGSGSHGSYGASHSYLVGGTLSGLVAGGRITVSNGIDNTILTVNGQFFFTAKVENGARYEISITELPAKQSCSVLNGGGVVEGENVININVFCGPLTVDAWFPAGSLASARGLHTATLLPSGKVLVTGGIGVRGLLSSAELYDPVSNSWSPARSLLSSRVDHTATLLSDGRVLVVGGVSSFGSLTLPAFSSELYDPATDTWEVAGSLAAPHMNHTATRLSSGRVLVAGGGNDRAEIYDPELNAWTTAGKLSVARANHLATLLPSGRVLVTGGFGSDVFASTEMYDPATNEWKAIGNLVAARAGHTANLLPDGHVLVAGGVTATLPVASAETYDPVMNVWTTGGSMISGRQGHTASLLSNGKVLVVGGYNGIEALATTERYDPAAHSWTAAGNLTDARSKHTATLLQSGKLLVSGGQSGSAFISSAELYW